MKAGMRNPKVAKGTKLERVRAFTLVESLAVVVLLALAMSALALGVAPSIDAARLRDARAAVLDLDARSRVLAHQGQAVLLRADDLLVTAGPLMRRELPVGISVSLLDAQTREPLESVRIDTKGRSIDYILRVTRHDEIEETLVAGLTGYAFETHRAGGGNRP